MPYYRKQPADAEIRLSRNNQIKDQLFYDVIRQHEFKTMCCRVDQLEERQKVRCSGIVISNYHSVPDCWLHYKRNPLKGESDENICVFQAVHVDDSSQFAKLQTRALQPETGGVRLDYHIVSRQTDHVNQVASDYPFVVHNLGDQRIVLVNYQQPEPLR